MMTNDGSQSNFFQSAADELRLYADTLRKDLDEYTEGNELHTVEIFYHQARVRVEIALYRAADAPPNRVLVQPSMKLAGEKNFGLKINRNSLVFMRPNNRFNFSPGYAQKDANEIIGYILANNKLSAEDILKYLNSSAGNSQSDKTGE